MATNLFNTLIAEVHTDKSGTSTKLFLPSGKLHATIPATEAQPRFAKQRYIMLNKQYYSLCWRLTPATPKVA